MILSEKELGKLLLNELDKGYNIERISNWANEILYTNMKQHSLEIKDILRHIMIMDAGPEFHYSEKELRIIAEMLMADEKDPFKKIEEMK